MNSITLRKRIRRLVMKNPQLADDDNMLIAAVWNEEGWIDPALYEKLASVTSTGAITRTRRRLESEGLIKASEVATEMRRKKSRDTKDKLGY